MSVKMIALSRFNVGQGMCHTGDHDDTAQVASQRFTGPLIIPLEPCCTEVRICLDGIWLVWDAFVQQVPEFRPICSDVWSSSGKGSNFA